MGKPVPEYQFWILLQQEKLEVAVVTAIMSNYNQSSSQLHDTNIPTLKVFLQADCPSCHPISSVKAVTN